jgi:hypothetical protein
VAAEWVLAFLFQEHMSLAAAAVLRLFLAVE